MKSFEEMWEQAKSLGAEVKGLAEDLYQRYKDKIAEEDMQEIINLIAEVHGWLSYLDDNKVDIDDFKAELNKLKKMLKEHSHLADKVVAPVE